MLSHITVALQIPECLQQRVWHACPGQGHDLQDQGPKHHWYTTAALLSLEMIRFVFFFFSLSFTTSFRSATSGRCSWVRGRNRPTWGQGRSRSKYAAGLKQVNRTGQLGAITAPTAPRIFQTSPNSRLLTAGTFPVKLRLQPSAWESISLATSWRKRAMISYKRWAWSNSMPHIRGHVCRSVILVTQYLFVVPESVT